MKVCKLCGKEITDSDRRSYCSEECAIEANRIRSREKYHSDVDKLSTPVKCMNCGKEFIRRQEKQKYCCYSCKQEMVYAEKRLRYKIENLAKTMNFELKNVDKILRAKKMLFSGNDLHRCPCDAGNPDRFCGSAQCIADVVYQGHCHCSLFWSKKEPLLKDDNKVK